MRSGISLIKKTSIVFIALTGWFSLGLQLCLSIRNARGNGVSVTESVINFFSYFTVLTNLLVALSLTSILLAPFSRLGDFFSKPSAQSAIAVYISVVGIVYTIALRNVWDPQGLQLIADRLLHDAVPVFYLIFWSVFTPKRTLKWESVLPWLIYPLIYLFYALIRGATTGWFSYYFLNFRESGWKKVFISIFMIMAAFIALSLVLILINRLPGKKKVNEN